MAEEDTGIEEDEAAKEMQRLRERHLAARRRLRSLRTQQIVAEKKVEAVENGSEISEEELNLQAQEQAKQEVDERVKNAISASESGLSPLRFFLSSTRLPPSCLQCVTRQSPQINQ